MVDEFDPKSTRQFVIDAPIFDLGSDTIRLRFHLDDVCDFEELVEIPGLAKACKDDASHEVIVQLADFLAIAASVSYYKAACPPVVYGPPEGLAQGSAELLRELIHRGLGEFAFVNQVDLRSVPEIHFDEVAPIVRKKQFKLSSKVLVAIGGGKDSLVTLEALRATKHDVVLFAVNGGEPVARLLDAIKLSTAKVSRTLDPRLLGLNERGALNGHIPVTAINSFISAITAVVNDCGAIVFSNERSASYGNVEWLGEVVNHQWSKSLEAERLFQRLISSCTNNAIEYFSLLRPFSELDIMRAFATLTQWHELFTSCNHAFRLDPERRVQRWCGECPKCRFVFLTLGAFITREELLAIFDQDLLADSTQFAGFLDLVGFGEMKPFECVGEPYECIVALDILTKRADWMSETMPGVLGASLGTAFPPSPEVSAQAFMVSDEHHVPQRFQTALAHIVSLMPAAPDA